jgi:hypothetical protein
VASAARSFNAITSSEVFEILDPEGRIVASVGPRVLDPRVRRRLARAALTGSAGASLESLQDAQYQVVATPVMRESAVVGILLLGSRIGVTLAQQLRAFTRSEVTFFSGQVQTVSTLSRSEDRDALSRPSARSNGRAASPRRPTRCSRCGPPRMSTSRSRAPCRSPHPRSARST